MGRKKILKWVILIALIVFVLVIAIDIYTYYRDARDGAYTSIEELLEDEYKAGAIVVNEDDYYYVVDKEDYTTELVMKLDEDKYIFFNQFHEETKRSYFDKIFYMNDSLDKDLTNSTFYTFTIRIYNHCEKYIILIRNNTELNGTNPVYDEIGVLDGETHGGRNYLIRVIDREKVNENYKINMVIDDVECTVVDYAIITGKEE